MSAFKFQKSVQLLNYFAIEEGGTINKLKALKLMWAAERLHLRTQGSTIVNDDFYAMKLGPVPSFTKDMAEGCNTLSEEESAYRNATITTVSDFHFKSNLKFDDSYFSNNAIKAMELSYTELGKYDGFELANITHLYPEWSKFSSVIPSVYSRMDMDYLDFFNDPKDQLFKIFIQDPEHLESLKEYYVEQLQLAKAIYSL